MMRFIIHMINVIEPSGTVKLQDLINSLKLSIKACFPFGMNFVFILKLKYHILSMSIF